jgi:Rrf2 family transcriptional regulator, cysteine metabolism repressor
MLCPTASKYAISAAVYLARHPGPSVASQIAEDCDLPPFYLAKILKDLAKQGFLSSVKGAHGGFRLVVTRLNFGC